MRLNRYPPSPPVVALGGTSYAAIALPQNSVGSKQIKKSAVTAKKIDGNAVNSSKVKNGSLLAGDFRAGRRANRGPRASRGPKVDRGRRASGDTNGATNVTARSATGSTSFLPLSPAIRGERATGGGGWHTTDGYIYLSRPTPQSGTPTEWEVHAGPDRAVGGPG